MSARCGVRLYPSTATPLTPYVHIYCVLLGMVPSGIGMPIRSRMGCAYVLEFLLPLLYCSVFG